MNIFCLKELGDDSNQIYRNLKKLSIKGTRRSRRECPILMYLLDKTGWKFKTDNDYNIFDFDPRVPIPVVTSAVIDFMKDFDKGLYPKLEI